MPETPAVSAEYTVTVTLRKEIVRSRVALAVTETRSRMDIERHERMEADVFRTMLHEREAELIQSLEAQLQREQLRLNLRRAELDLRSDMASHSKR